MKYRMKRKLYETCPDDDSERLTVRKALGLGIKCMRDGAIWCPGESPVFDDEEDQQELRDAARDIMIVEEESPAPGAKIVFLDYGYFGINSANVDKHIDVIIRYERRKEVLEGRPSPRLIFVKKDRDYWPFADKDPDALARRSVKDKASQGLSAKPDYHVLFVPRSLHTKICNDMLDFDNDFIEQNYNLNNERRLKELETERVEYFNRYFNPSLPGTKFIVQNMDSLLRHTFYDCMANPDLRDAWLKSSLAHIIPIPSQHDDVFADEEEPKYDGHYEAEEGNYNSVDNIDDSAGVKHDSSSSARKIFVGGIASETSEESLRRHFGKYGEITDSVIMMDRVPGRSRGFGYLTFADPQVAEKVLQEDHVIDGRAVELL